MSVRAASPDVMATRVAVGSALQDLVPGQRVIVACSGGPDSLALVAAAAWVAERSGLVASAVVVDHGLQSDSAAVAAQAADTCGVLGVPARVIRVQVGTEGGPEAAARTARYAALAAAADGEDAAVVLLGHTLEDQAETVLLRLARGSGARSLAAMSARTDPWRRPFLALPRATVRSAADEVLAAIGRAAWADPHNDDPAFARVRARALLDRLTEDLGPGAVLGLARSADLLRDDADALDAIAADAYVQVVRPDPEETAAEGAGLTADCESLAALPTAVRTRVIRSMALACGSPADALGVDHVRQVDALVTDWRGQGETSLPGGVRARRECGRLCLQPSPRE